jgi:hypothetical protein
VICAGAGASAFAPGAAPDPRREINVGFGQGTPYIGVYALLTIDGRSLAFKAFGLKAAGADDVIDSFALTR